MHAFGDESVLYNDLSGDTHLLGGSAVLLLALLQRGSTPTGALRDALAQALGCTRDPGFDAEADALLAQLAGFFLIEPLPC